MYLHAFFYMHACEGLMSDVTVQEYCRDWSYACVCVCVCVCVTGENGLMSSRVYDVQMAVQKEARLLLIQDTEDFDNLSCQERVTSAEISSKSHSFASEPVSTDELCLTFLQWLEPVNSEP